MNAVLDGVDLATVDATFSESPSSDGESSIRECRVCSSALSAARLKARPGTTICVPCLEAEGDVVTIKRLDEYVGDDIVSSYFQRDPYKEDYLSRRGQLTGVSGNLGG